MTQWSLALNSQSECYHLTGFQTILHFLEPAHSFAIINLYIWNTYTYKTILLHYVPKNVNQIFGKRGECPNIITRFTYASVSTVPVDCKNVSILNIRIQLQKELSPIVHGLAAAIIWICATFFHRCWLTILWANFADQTQIKNQQVFI